jgi:type I restriction enzyme R subunit
LLSQLGWTFLPPEQALTARNGKLDEVVLRSELRAQLEKRRYIYAGQEHALSAKAIDNIISEVCSPALNEGLALANEKTLQPLAVRHRRYRIY